MKITPNEFVESANKIRSEVKQLAEKLETSGLLEYGEEDRMKEHVAALCAQCDKTDLDGNKIHDTWPCVYAAAFLSTGYAHGSPLPSCMAIQSIYTH